MLTTLGKPVNSLFVRPVFPEHRISPEFLTQEVSELTKKVKGLEKKCKKAPDDVKPKLSAFLKDSEKSLEELSSGLKDIEKRLKATAEYFCEDSKKLKIEDLLGELFRFVTSFEAAVEV